MGAVYIITVSTSTLTQLGVAIAHLIRSCELLGGEQDLSTEAIGACAHSASVPRHVRSCVMPIERCS
jgi:hypothetical protein